MNNLRGKILKLALAVSLAGTGCATSYAQAKPPAKPPSPAPSWPTPKAPPTVWATLPDGTTTERSMAVDPTINLTLCVVEGRVTINGWNRAELRILVRVGSNFTFNVKQKGRGDQPVWVEAISVKQKGAPNSPSTCITGEEIEIDVPVTATLNLKGQETRTTIDMIKRVDVTNIGGNISIRNVSGGVKASTYEGDITVEESKGQMQLDTTSGNIIVFAAGPSEIGDIFKVKTNSGAVSLERLGHRQVEVGSISGAVYYTGPILSGGSYSFGTNNGTVRLFLPEKTNCQVSATFGGSFASELPFKRSTEDVRLGPVRTVNGTLGTGGDAVVKLTNNSGGISIRKQPPQ